MLTRYLDSQKLMKSKKNENTSPSHLTLIRIMVGLYFQQQSTEVSTSYHQKASLVFTSSLILTVIRNFNDFVSNNIRASDASSSS